MVLGAALSHIILPQIVRHPAVTFVPIILFEASVGTKIGLTDLVKSAPKMLPLYVVCDEVVFEEATNCVLIRIRSLGNLALLHQWRLIKVGRTAVSELEDLLLLVLRQAHIA